MHVSFAEIHNLTAILDVTDWSLGDDIIPHRTHLIVPLHIRQYRFYMIALFIFRETQKAVLSFVILINALG